MAQPNVQGAARFRIVREIGNTLQGRVYAAIDLAANQKPCIVKEAWRQLVHSKRSRSGYAVPEDFLKERALIMELTNLPHVAPGKICKLFHIACN